MAMEEVIARLELADQKLERWRGETRDLTEKQRLERLEARDFMQALTQRSAEIADLHIGALRALGAEILDGREQIRANTQAVLRLLDERFGPEPPRA